MVWKIDDPQGAESHKIKYEIVPYTRGRGLDLGCGIWKTYPHFIGVDNLKQWGSTPSPSYEMAVKMNIDVVTDCDNLEMFASGSMDFVFSSHLLEHIKDAEKALKEWWRVVKIGGHLVLYLPHKDFYPNVGREGANPDHKHDFIPKDIIAFMKEIAKSTRGWDLLRSEKRNNDNEYSFLQVYKKREGKECVHGWNSEKPGKTVGVVRYGGFGDMIQTSSLFPVLKDQGYHITLFTTPSGHNIVKDDPHIDEFIIQQNDQVPNEELVPYWKCWSEKFDKWVNLSESVEGTFLVIPGRAPYLWTTAARHRLFNVNYLEFMHEIAAIPYKPNVKFYPTEKEIRKARKLKEKIGPCVMWVLDGSSVHKHWPWMDNAIARVLTESSLKVVTVGNELSKMLESGWENEPRVIKNCGAEIRDTLALAQLCEIVVGPETGVMNSVSFEDNMKVVFLSHSSEENLTRDWVNCIALAPERCECYPCHKMIMGWEHCHRESENFKWNDKTLIIEGARCQVNIGVEQFWKAFLEIHKIKKAA